MSTCTEPVTETQGQDDKRSDKASLEEPFSDEMELATKSATSNKEEEEDIDENEMSRIKEFLEETVSCHWYSQRHKSMNILKIPKYFLQQSHELHKT